MAEIRIIIRDVIQSDGSPGVSINYEGDFKLMENGVTLTQAQVSANTIKGFMDLMETTTFS